MRHPFSPLPVLFLLTLSFLIMLPHSFADAVGKTFDLIEVTDFHGYLTQIKKLKNGYPLYQPRAAVMSKAILDLKAEIPATFVLAGGDMFQGTAFSNYFRGKPVLEFMKKVGFDVMVLGNHEYDWGPEVLIDPEKALLKDTSIPVLAANIFLTKTNALPGYVKPYALLSKEGVKIGVIGIVDDQEFPTVIMPERISEVTFSDPVKIVQNLSEKLRQEGASFIVVLAHMGAKMDRKNGKLSGNLLRFAQHVSGVDAIFGGHSHTVVTTEVNGIPVGIAGSEGYGFLDLKITLGNDSTIQSKTMTYHSLAKEFNRKDAACDEVLQKCLRKYESEIEKIFAEVIGEAKTALTRSPSCTPYGDSSLGNWAAEATKNAACADFGFANNGGLRSDLPKGKITLGQIYELMPFDNTLITVKMTGSEIRDFLNQAIRFHGKGLQVAGLSFTYCISDPGKSWVQDIRDYKGKALLPEALYTVATNNFIGTGGDGFSVFTRPSVKATFKDTGKCLRDIFIDTFRSQKTVSSFQDQRICQVEK